MWNNLVQTTFPSTPAIDLASVKAHLRVSFTDDDTYITSLISAATAYLDGPHGIGVPLQVGSYRASFDAFPCDPGGLILPLFPVVSVDSVSYLSQDGTTNTLPTSIYCIDLDSNPVRIKLAFGQAWPTTMPQQGVVKVNFTAGFVTTPPDLIHAIKLLVSNWYSNRDAVVGIDSRDSPAITPYGVEALIGRYRVMPVG